MKMDQEKQANEPEANPATKKTGFFSFLKKHPTLSVAIVGLILVMVVFLWKEIQRRQESKRLHTEMTVKMEEKNIEMLQLLGKPMVWSIRNEMLRSNMEQINVFMADFVKEKNMQFMHLIDTEGVFISSTNKRLEGLPVGEMFDVGLLKSETIEVRVSQNQSFIMAAPVMGYDKRLATLILEYKTDNTHNVE